MKYLKFLKQNNIPQLAGSVQSNFTFVLESSIPQGSKFGDDDIKTIEVRLTGREVASLCTLNDNYDIEAALFTIAKNYIVENIETEKEIINNKKLFLDASDYLNHDAESPLKFHSEVIKIEI